MELKEKIIKIKAHIDMLKDSFAEELFEPIMGCIPYEFEDDVFEFEIVIRKVKNITKEIGVDEEGARAFCGVEIRKGEE